MATVVPAAVPPGEPPTPAPPTTPTVTGSQQSDTTCDGLIAAHPSPGYRLEAFDYLYLHELRLARRELRRGNLELAHAALCRSSRAPGADSNVWFELAQVSLMRDEAPAALPWLEKLLALDTTNRFARALLGDALFGSGRIDEARAEWLKAARIRSDDGLATTNLAAGYFGMAEQAARRRDVIAAKRFYRRAIGVDPSHERAQSRLAELLAKPAPSR